MTPKLLTVMKDYSARLLLADGVAGVTVALVALPLSIAIAIASGAPPAAGLATAVVAGFLISALGGSRVQIGGPTGAFIVVVYGIIEAHGFDGLLVATLMAGVILVTAALLRLGRLIVLVPEAVIEGFTIGIAIIIAASQLKDLLGLPGSGGSADLIEIAPDLWSARMSVNPYAAAAGIGVVVLIAGLRRFAPRVPASVIAVALATFAVAAFALPVDTVQARFGPLPAGLPYPSLPRISLPLISELLPSAFVIAFLAGVESLLSAIVADRMIGGKHRSNAELLAQGAANIASPLFGGIPATGAIARTATNVRAGGRTPVAGMIHALAILLVMLIAAPMAGYLAMPALAGLLLVTAWAMSEPGRWRERFRLPRWELALLFLTMFLTVFSNLTVAIAVGTTLGLAERLLRREVEPAEWTPRDR